MRTLGVVTTSFPQHEADMAGRFVHTLLRTQHAAESVHVLAIGSFDETRWQDGLRITRVASKGLFDADGAPEVWDRSQGRQRARVAAEALRIGAALTRSVGVHARGWHAVQSHWLVPSALSVALAAPSLFHTAFVHSGDLAWLEAAPGGGPLTRWLLERVNQVICVSPALAERLCALVGPNPPLAKLKVQAMPVDPVVFGAQAKAPIRQNMVLGVGRLVPIKGFDRLILAVGGLALATRPSVVLLGEGPERARLAALARKLGVRLHMPGVVSPAEVRLRMQQAAVCAVPSRPLASGRTEGAPLVLREAMAAGVPVVVSHGLVGSERAPLVATALADDVAALRAALRKVLRTQAGVTA